MIFKRTQFAVIALLQGPGKLPREGGESPSSQCSELILTQPWAPDPLGLTLSRGSDQMLSRHPFQPKLLHYPELFHVSLSPWDAQSPSSPPHSLPFWWQPGDNPATPAFLTPPLQSPASLFPMSWSCPLYPSSSAVEWETPASLSDKSSQKDEQADTCDSPVWEYNWRAELGALLSLSQPTCIC